MTCLVCWYLSDTFGGFLATIKYGGYKNKQDKVLFPGGIAAYYCN